MSPIGSSPLYAALVGAVDAVIAVLIAFHAGPALTQDQRTAVLGVLGAGFVLATLVATYFQHSNAQLKASIDHDPAKPVKIP